MPTKVTPDDFYLTGGSGPIHTHFLDIPTGLSISMEGKPKARKPLQFIATLGRITDDSDYVRDRTLSELSESVVSNFNPFTPNL